MLIQTDFTTLFDLCKHLVAACRECSVALPRRPQACSEERHHSGITPVQRDYRNLAHCPEVSRQYVVIA